MKFRALFPVLMIALSVFTNASNGRSALAEETRVAGDLFSKITMSDVINEKENVTQGSPEKEAGSTGTSILGTQSLSKFLLRSDIKHDIQRNLITLNSPQATSGIVIRMTTDTESERIYLESPFRGLSDMLVIGDQTLLQILRTTSRFPNVNLSASQFDGQSEFVFQTWITNQQTTETHLRDAIDRLTTVVSATKTMASSIDEPLAKAAANKGSVEKTPSIPSAKVTSAKATTPQPSLLGTWSAKTSTVDGWAVRFDAVGTYTLVHTRNRKNTISKGTYQRTGESLTLTESNGTKLSGPLTMHSDDQFDWSLKNQSGVVSLTLSFKSNQ